jgi:hypothetical protein
VTATGIRTIDSTHSPTLTHSSSIDVEKSSYHHLSQNATCGGEFLRLPMRARPGVLSSPMATKRTSGELRLTEAEAKSLATEFVEVLQQLSLSNEQATPDEVAIDVRSAIRFFDKREVTVTKDTSLLLDVLSPWMGPESDKVSIDASLTKYPEELINSPGTGKGLHDSLTRIFLRASLADVTAFRQGVQKLKSLAANPLKLRDQLIGTLKKNNKGTPGPKKDISWDLKKIVECSDKLRPVLGEIFEQSKNSKQPLPEIIKAVSTLRPEWKTECDFLLANEDLVDRSMNLSKIKKAKARGKATMLADALACKFAGYDAAPAYSMQLVEQARRSLKS